MNGWWQREGNTSHWSNQNSLQERAANGLREILKGGDGKHELGTVRGHATHTDTSIGCGTNSMLQQGQARLEGEVEKRLHRCLGAGWWTRTLLRARGVFKCGGPGSEWCWGETGWWPGWDNQWRRQAPTWPWRERLQESKAEPAAEQHSRLAGEAGFHSNWKLRYC